MANEENEHIWRVVREANVELHQTLSCELLCKICKKMLINAYNSPCGCRYCWECINSYLDGQENVCPGDNEDCKTNRISLTRNIFIDQAANSRISKFVVKCPNPGCDFKDQLRRIRDHWRVCCQQSEKCPYYTIGCCQAMKDIDQIKEHVDVMNVTHSKLLIEAIGYLRRDVESVKSDNLVFKHENSNLNQEMSTMKLKLEEKQIEIVELTGKDIQKTGQISQINEMLLVQMDKVNYLGQQLQEVMSQNKLSLQSCSNFISTRSSKDCEFVWVIDGISRIINAASNTIAIIRSGSFPSHVDGYKLCLQADFLGIENMPTANISISLCVMKGPFDDLLPWPMKLDATLKLVDQESGLVHSSETLNCAKMAHSQETHKPNNEMSDRLSFIMCIKLDALLKSSGLCRNDQVIMKCLVTVPPR